MHSNSCATRVLYSNGGVTSQVTCRASRHEEIYSEYSHKNNYILRFCARGPHAVCCSSSKTQSSNVACQTTPQPFCFSPAFILSPNKKHLLSSCLKLSTSVDSLSQSAHEQGSPLLASYRRPFSLSNSPNTAPPQPLHTAFRPIGPDGSGLRALPFLFRPSRSYSEYASWPARERLYSATATYP